MFGSAILDVAIGLVFVFLLVSLICTAVREAIEAWLKSRATYLERGIRMLLGNGADGLVKQLYAHPLVDCLFEGEYVAPGTGLASLRGTKLPSYIPSANFAAALLDLAAGGPDHRTVGGGFPDLSVEAVRANLNKLGSERAQGAVAAALDASQGDLDRARASLEAWFDSAMDRVSGWYKRRTQWIVLGVGIGVAVGLNVSTIVIADYLYANSTARNAVVESAKKVAGEASVPSLTREQAMAQLDALGLPIGWEEHRPGVPSGEHVWLTVLMPLVGWLLTGFAASLGAPFWFDTLNKFMVIRSTVKPHEKSPEESSEDRQASAKRTPGDTAVAGGSSSAAPAAGTPSPAADQAVDGCNVEIVVPTPDASLPAAEGGVE
jgi:hypothetical protein